MNHYQNLQDLLFYIEENISSELTVDTLANKSYLSKYYFQRLFYQVVGQTIMEYVQLRRLAKASEKLLGEESITDIAFQSGFNHVESFSRAFKKRYHITPSQYRKEPLPLKHIPVPHLELKELDAPLHRPLVSSGIVLEMHPIKLDQAITLYGFQQEMDFVHVGQDDPGILWRQYYEQKPTLETLLKTHVEYGVSSPGSGPGKFNYMVGSPLLEGVEKNGLPKSLVSYTIPTGLYICCTFSAETFEALTTEAMDIALNYLLQDWLPKSDYDMIGDFSVEVYDQRALKNHPLIQNSSEDMEALIQSPPQMNLMVLVSPKV